MGRDRTDPHKSAQSGMFRGAGQTHGNQLEAEGGKRGSDIGSTKPMRLDEERNSTDTRPRKRGRKH